VGVVEAAQQGVMMSAGLTYQIVRLLGRAFTFNLNKEERRSIGGPVKIAQEVGKAARGGFYDLALMAAALSVNLGLMNLLPFPALDGGRILFLGYELIFRKPIDARKESFVHMVGMVALLAFMAFITVRDVLPWLERSLRSVF
jgi:regulator of sigma E protease